MASVLHGTPVGFGIAQCGAAQPRGGDAAPSHLAPNVLVGAHEDTVYWLGACVVCLGLLSEQEVMTGCRFVQILGSCTVYRCTSAQVLYHVLDSRGLRYSCRELMEDCLHRGVAVWCGPQQEYPA